MILTRIVLFMIVIVQVKSVDIIMKSIVIPYVLIMMIEIYVVKNKIAIHKLSKFLNINKNNGILALGMQVKPSSSP